MLLNYTVGISLPFVAGLIVIVLFAFIWKKMKKKVITGIVIGFFVGLALAAFLFVTPTKVYVVTGNKEMQKYLSIGSSSYTLKDGTSIPISAKMAHCTLINDAADAIVVEHVVYGDGYEEDDILEPGQYLDIEDPYIDYFFDGTPPESLETTSYSTYKVVLWLRMYSDYESDYLEYYDEEEYEEDYSEDEELEESEDL